MTLEVNGNWVGALHLFANPPETDAPQPGDPNVIYFGPGIHEVSQLVVRNNQTVYVAGGAVVRGVIRPDEQYRISGYSGLRTYAPTFELRGPTSRFAAGASWTAAAARPTRGTCFTSRAPTSPSRA